MPSSPSTRRALGACGVTTVALGSLFALRELPARVSRMFESGLPANPWFVVESVGLLYLVLPLAVLTGIAAWMLPGLLLTAAWRRDLDFSPWVLQGFFVSLVAQWVIGAAAAWVSEGAIADSVLLGAWFALTLGALAGFVWRTRRGPPLERVETPTPRRLLISAGLVWLAVILLLPRIFWQDLGSDGLEAFELGRSLAWFGLPRVPTEASVLGLGAGMVPQALPIRWFIVLWGPIEAAARIPLLLYSPPLLAGLIGLSEVRASRRLGWGGELGVALGLAMVVAAVGFNSTYSRYAVDLASPTSIEFGAVVLVIGALVAFWRDDAFFFLGFSALALLARPTAAVLILSAGIATLALEPTRRRRTLQLIGGVCGVWILVYLAYERGFVAQTSLESDAYSTEGLIHRFQFLTMTDWRRLIWVAAPAGILPFLFLFRWRGLDAIGRSAAAATLFSFTIVAVPAFVGLHHFVPMMLIPVGVFWRWISRNPSKRAPILGTYALVALVTFSLGLPPRFHVARDFREIGRIIHDRVGGYGSDDYTLHRDAQMVANAGVSTLFSAGWEVPDPAVELVGGPEFMFYARRGIDVDPTVEPVVLVETTAGPRLDGGITAGPDGARFVVLDSLAWQAVRDAERPTVPVSRLYHVPRSTLHRYIGEPAGHYDTSLSNWPVLWRLFQR